ncbi:MAG: AIPR family protein [Candidatus Anammoxibacter sp.]
MDKKSNKVIIKSEYARQYPDPINRDMIGDAKNIGHHILLCRAIEIPSGIPKDPNPRTQKIDYSIYKGVRDSLEDGSDLSFHLKNKGITMYAHKVDYSDDKKVATIHMGEGDGIADGGHTYEIILASKSDGLCPENQYVKIEVLTGVPLNMRVDITGGLNTTVQVQAASLANLEGKFEWLKDTIKGMDYAESIAYKQNEKAPFNIRDIISILTLFNVNQYLPPKHPRDAYVSKGKCLELYLREEDSYKMLKPILKDILYLYDYVQIKGKEKYNAQTGGKAGAMKGVYTEKRKRGNYHFSFMNMDADQKLYDGALYPILGAMRYLVEQKSGEDVYSWRLSSFDEVKKFFDEIAPELIGITHNTSVQYGLKPTSVGKDNNHWALLHKSVALKFLT